MRRMLAIVLAMLCCTVLCSMAWAGEIAYTVRATLLKEKPYTDARTLATLEQRSRVVVVSRQASWMQVKTNAGSGWVKMLSLQFSDAGKQNKKGDSGLRALFNVASGGGGGSVTTGVRGLSEEDLKNAQPNPQALLAVQGYAVSKSAAKNFAKAGNLSELEMEYVTAPEKGADNEK